MTASQNKTSLSQLIDKTKDVDNCRDKEVIPGIFWMSEDNGANMLIDSRGDGDRVIVHLKPEFEIEKVEEIQSGKSYRISGSLNGQSSQFSMVYGKIIFCTPSATVSKPMPGAMPAARSEPIPAITS